MSLHEKYYIFTHMSVRLGGGGLKALIADMSAKNVIYLGP